MTAASRRQAYADAEQLARREAKNFYYSFLILPKPQRQSMCALYAFLRLTDDLGDDDSQRPLEERRRALTAWRTALADAFTDADGVARRTGHTWWPALIDTLHRYEIPREHLTAVIDGVTRDLTQHTYETTAELEEYCYCVASAVGLACIRIWGATDPRADIPAERCGQAFQLTNILRDVSEDYANGRVYLPQEELRRFGVGAADFANRSATPAVEALLRDQIQRAEAYYEASRELDAFLPPAGRAVLHVMRAIYWSLLRKIAAGPTAVLRERVSLSRGRKLALLASGIPTRLGLARLPALPAVGTARRPASASKARPVGVGSSTHG